MSAAVYIVLAYRWGNANDHWYYLYAGVDETKAMAMAESERDGRGNKYGCVVMRTNELGELWEQHAYFACGKEEEPTFNWRLEYFERLGHVLDSYVDGHLMIPEEGKRTMTGIKVEPIPLLVEEAARHRRMYEAMGDSMAKAKAEQKARSALILCPCCDGTPVYEVEYCLEVMRVAREPDRGRVEVEELHGHYCRHCGQLSQRPEHISYNQMKISIARARAMEE